MAAQAAIVAEAVDGPVRVELHDQAGYCQNGALLAVWIEDENKLTGCWRVTNNIVQIAWADADVSRAPTGAFRPLQSAR